MADSIESWVEHAAQLRRSAKETSDLDLKGTLNRMAEHWEQLAAAERAKSRSAP